MFVCARSCACVYVELVVLHSFPAAVLALRITIHRRHLLLLLVTLITLTVNEGVAVRAR